ncbi:plasma membrane Ca2 ATPase [Trypanosoma cruzi Dm28c]|uniref:Calcium-transporting ATPase n=2 Tax=Trypanosoma cruzi TaxID=5693 RepID=V5B873_TRYCR|nr:plasma membrane Ca2 ATPase [Trypanosoma cruzi Dm28c]PBJ74378.1 plasma membrane Ca2+ ATPase [Trypanosoma cruzi cruzi]PWU91137.1 plasma membrane Ca2+ ATPase [Trypanosoma cruzi]
MRRSSNSFSYGSCDEMEEETKMRRSRLMESVRRRTPIHLNFTDGDDVGVSIRTDLENIFARANEGMPLYEKLGRVEGIAAKLQMDLSNGVRSDSVERRRTVFGRNELPEEEELSFWRIYKAAWSDQMILLLSGAAFVSLVLGLTVPEPGRDKADTGTGWIEGFAILVSVLIVTTVSSVNDYRKELKFRQLMEENSAQPIAVIRDGREQVIDVTEIVVGDIVSLSTGLVVPVDGFYVRGLSVVIDESSVTGENDLKKKGVQAPILLTGTVVNTAEDAYMLACAVGESSFGGKLLMESRQEGGPRMTPLQERLDELAGLIGRFGMGSAVLLFSLLSLLEVFRIIRGTDDFHMKTFLDHFLLCVTIVVVAVPEGLPLAVTIALAYSQKKMQEDNNQVRRLCACETMGCATQICSDKTGTLTQNLMSVVQGYIGLQRFNVRDPGDVPTPIVLRNVPAASRDLLVEGLSLNSSSEKVVCRTGRDGESVARPYWQWRVDKGNKTDNALLDFVDRVLLQDGDPTDMTSRPHQRVRERGRAHGFAIFPFTSERKFMSVVVAGPGGVLTQHVKGGSDRVLEMCDRYVSASGAEEPLTDSMRTKIVVQIRSLANDANRTIGVAYGRVDGEALPASEPTVPLVWLALVGIQDPLRPEVPDAVRKCQQAGVTVRMCTGDNLDTAVAISRQCGIYNRLRGDVAMTGKEFRSLVYDAYGSSANMEKFWPILDRMVVMARSQPLDKQLLVLMLMMRGEVVAVTGDGTNDAPALRLANVGFVMRSGTDIAVKSSDIVLLDDNFRSVQRAVVWGRTVNDNIRKFLQLQLTVNVSSVVLTFLGSFLSSSHTSPLSTVQLLWVNLIMDTLAALALATEEPSEACLDRGPIPRKAPLVSRRMWCTILAIAGYQTVSTLLVERFGGSWFDVSGGEMQTIVFNVFLLSVIFHMFNARKLYEEMNCFEGLWERSRIFVCIVGFCFAFQVFSVEMLGSFMQVVSLRGEQWVGCLALSFLTLVFGAVARLVPVEELPVPEAEMDDMEPEARRMAMKLTADVEAHAAREGAGGHLLLGRRLLAQAMWQQVREHHIAVRSVNAFRRARIDRDMHTSVAKDIYCRLASTMQ